MVILIFFLHMKPTSILGESFSTFSMLIRTRWSAYAWYILCRVLELLAFGGLMALSFFLGAFSFMEQGSVILPMLLFGLGIAGAFLLESLFTFSLYRSLDKKTSKSSFADFLHAGAQNYWQRLGRYVLFSLLVGAVFYSGSFLLEMVSVRLGMVGDVLAVVFFAAILYFSVSIFMTFFEVIVSDQWPWMTFQRMVKKLKGFWWRIFGSLVLWGLLTVVVYAVFGVMVGLLIFAGLGSFLTSFPTSEGASAMQIMQSLSQLVSLGVLGPLFLSVLLFVALSIVPVYGVFSVYEAVRKIAK